MLLVSCEDADCWFYKENIEKAAAILYSYAYPSGLSLGNSLETRMYALTYDGILYSLNQWTDIDL